MCADLSVGGRARVELLAQHVCSSASSIRPALATAIEQVWPDSFTAFTKHLHDGLEHLIRALQTDAFAPLIAVKNSVVYSRCERGWLHESNLLAVEQRLAMKIQNILCSDVVVRDLPMQTVDAFKYITDEQRVAVRSALNNRLTLITGGPGTGKTSIIVAIIHAINHLGVSLDSTIRLTAPTGKAAFVWTNPFAQGSKPFLTQTMSCLPRLPCTGC